jgi:hypothetical protein
VPSLRSRPFASPRPAEPGPGCARSAAGSLAGAAVLALLLGAVGARAQLVPCRRGADMGRIADALDHIRRSTDPCGESPEIARLLDELQHCTRARYEICIDATASRNLFERPDKDGFGTITWNPELRSELESGCGGDPARHVMRDPVASLLHEIVHAAHDCAGLDPGEYELEAVRVENIYRRAAGLCSRSGYGDDRLAVEPAKGCAPERCECSAAPVSASQTTPRPAAVGRQAADSQPAPGEIGAADPAR